MKKYFTIILLMFFFLPAFAQSQWIDQKNDLEVTKLGFGAVDAIDSNTAVIGGEKSEIFITTNGGYSWYMKDYSNAAGSSNEVIIDISMVDKNNTWLSTDTDQILMTSDGGDTWQKQWNHILRSVLLSGKLIAMSPEESGYLFLTFFS